MKTLKTENCKKTVLRSYTFKSEHEIKLNSLECKILFSGTKTELLQKPEEFWKPLVQQGIEFYKNYKGSHQGWFLTALASGQSAIEGEGEFILITEENI